MARPTTFLATIPIVTPTYPRQDAETGRDAQTGLSKADEDSLASAGFDFTKLDSDGTPLPANATNWDCVRDNVTGLIWEIKTNGGLRNVSWTYTWCNTNASTNGGSAGTCDTANGVGSDNCFDNARCDTEKYVEDVKTLALCGYTDWRMPTVGELRGILDFSNFGAGADPAYFIPAGPSYYLLVGVSICPRCRLRVGRVPRRWRRLRHRQGRQCRCPVGARRTVARYRPAGGYQSQLQSKRPGNHPDRRFRAGQRLRHGLPQENRPDLEALR